MGQEIAQQGFTTQDFARFDARLRRETDLLQRWFDESAFADGRPVGGFEVEAWLVGEQAEPRAWNQTFLTQLGDPHVVPELSQYNFEINVPPRVLSDDALGGFLWDLQRRWQRCRQVAGKLHLDTMCVGIHPLLQDEHLTPLHMSVGQRYRALNERILALRGGTPIELAIDGRESLRSLHRDVMLEAATTSFQIHLQIPQQHAVRAYNAAQIISAPLLAVSANAPFLFGRDLWDETRIPLFEQSVDLGAAGRARVTFGDAYVRDSLFEIFAENRDAFCVLMPAISDEPENRLLCVHLHNGTIWRWNRPLVGFGANGMPHLRIENRVVPAGPTLVDMLANAALFWGLVQALVEQPVAAESLLPFATAKQNFYRAAQSSLDSELVWLDGQTHACRALILRELLPLARQGLASLGIADGDSSRFLGVIEGRTRTGQTGSAWLRAWVAKHGRDMKRLSQVYLAHQHSGLPVHEWGPPEHPGELPEPNRGLSC